MGRIAIIDRRYDPDRDRDQVRKRGSGSVKGYVSAIKKNHAHHCIYDTLILLYLFIRILTTF